MSGNTIKWDKRFALGIPIIDKQHHHLVDMTNSLYGACLVGNDTAQRSFKRVVHEAVEYVQYHFSTEERIMLKLKYANYAEHKKQHGNFILEVLRQTREFEEGKKFVPNTFVNYLRDWILSHIAVYDRKFAEYIVELKNQGGLERMLEKNTADGNDAEENPK